MSDIVDDDDDGEAVAMEDSDLEEETDEVLKLWWNSSQNCSIHSFFRQKWKLLPSVKICPKSVILAGKSSKQEPTMWI